MDSRDLLPWVGDCEAREAWDELFSREMLGAVVIGSAAGKVVESVVVIIAASPEAQLVAWVVAMFVGIYVFVTWHRITEAAKQKAEDAAEAAEEAVDSE